LPSWHAAEVHRSDGGRARGLDQQARVVPQQLHRRAHLVVADQHHLVDVRLRQRQRVGADRARRQRAGDGLHAVERDELAGGEAVLHRGGARRLHADDAGRGRERLDDE
jgi:hypothetical protein